MNCTRIITIVIKYRHVQRGVLRHYKWFSGGSSESKILKSYKNRKLQIKKEIKTTKKKYAYTY